MRVNSDLCKPGSLRIYRLRQGDKCSCSPARGRGEREREGRNKKWRRDVGSSSSLVAVAVAIALVVVLAVAIAVAVAVVAGLLLAPDIVAATTTTRRAVLAAHAAVLGRGGLAKTLTTVIATPALLALKKSISKTVTRVWLFLLCTVSGATHELETSVGVAGGGAGGSALVGVAGIVSVPRSTGLFHPSHTFAGSMYMYRVFNETHLPASA